jgi:hypothetical protein
LNYLKPLNKLGMKNILVILLTFLTVSCCHNKEGETIAPEESGFYIIAKCNNQDWKGDVAIMSKLIPDTLLIWGSVEAQGIGVDELEMRVKFKGVGSYEMTTGQVSLRNVVGGDGVMGVFELARGESVKLEVTRYDSTSQIMEGKFEGILRKRHGDVDLPESLSFVSGRFRGKMDQ